MKYQKPVFSHKNNKKFILDYFRIKNPQTRLALIASLTFIIAILTIWPQANDKFSKINLSSQEHLQDVIMPILDLSDSANLSAQELNEIREQYFEQTPGFITGSYHLRKSLYNSIDNASSWISKHDSILRDSGALAIEGGPLESLEITNPSLLIYPNFEALSLSAPNPWKVDSIIQASALKNRKFPVLPGISLISWKPQSKLIEATFNLRDFQNNAGNWMNKKLELADLSFNPSGFNAFDLGLQWVSLTKNSINIQNQDLNTPIPILSFVLNDEKAFCPTASIGCKTISSIIFPSPIEIKGLPAQAVFKLWLDEPKDSDQPADLTYKMNFQ